MPALDKFRSYTPMPFAAAQNGARVYSQLDNNKRYERFNLHVTGSVAIAATNAAALASRGSILSLLKRVGLEDAGADIAAVDARLAAFYADAFGTRPRAATRLTAAQLAIGGPYALTEDCPIWLAAPQTMNPNESKYAEVNKQALLRAFLTPNVPSTAANQFGGVATPGAGTTFTWTLLNADLTASYDDLVAVPPQYTVFLRQIEVPVTSSVTGLKIDLRGSRYVRAIVLQQDSDVGEVADIIPAANGLVLRGDAQSLLGDKAIPFADLQYMMAVEQGVDPTAGYLAIDMCRYGRLGSMWNPAQDTNLRFEVNTAVSAGANPVLRVLMVEYQRTAATETDPHVRP